jgi:hypothetical protein
MNGRTIGILTIAFFLSAAAGYRWSQNQFLFGDETGTKTLSVTRSDGNPTAAKGSFTLSERNLNLWRQHHTLLLPIALGIFFATFGGWSLISVENLAIRPHN